jgi:hypothetical protein
MKMHSLRPSIFAPLFLAVVIGSAAPMRASDDQKPGSKPAGPTLRIVNDTLVKVDHGDCHGCLYAVKGSIYNPNSEGVKNVVIKYFIWKKFMGKTDAKRGRAVAETGGLVTARIKFLPPNQTIDFLANEGIAPVYADVEPNPINAEIAAGWDNQ